MIRRVIHMAAISAGLATVASCAAPSPQQGAEAASNPGVQLTGEAGPASTSDWRTVDLQNIPHEDLARTTSPLPDLSRSSLWSVLGLVQGTPAFVPESLEELRARATLVVRARVAAVLPTVPEGTSETATGVGSPTPLVNIRLSTSDGQSVDLIQPYPVQVTPENVGTTVPTELPLDEYVWFLTPADVDGKYYCASVQTCALTVEQGAVVAPLAPEFVGSVFPDVVSVRSLDELFEHSAR